MNSSHLEHSTNILSSREFICKIIINSNNRRSVIRVVIIVFVVVANSPRDVCPV